MTTETKLADILFCMIQSVLAITDEEVLVILKQRCLRSHLTEREEILQSMELEETVEQKDKQLILEINKQEASEQGDGPGDVGVH